VCGVYIPKFCKNFPFGGPHPTPAMMGWNWQGGVNYSMPNFTPTGAMCCPWERGENFWIVPSNLNTGIRTAHILRVKMNFVYSCIANVSVRSDLTGRCLNTALNKNACIRQQHSSTSLSNSLSAKSASICYSNNN